MNFGPGFESQSAYFSDNLLLGNYFWREGLEAAFGPERRGEKGGGLRKACYWLQMAHISGFDADEIIDQAHAQTGPHEPKRITHEPKRIKAQRESLVRHRVILERLGCIDEAGMILLKRNQYSGYTEKGFGGKGVSRKVRGLRGLFPHYGGPSVCGVSR